MYYIFKDPVQKCYHQLVITMHFVANQVHLKNKDAKLTAQEAEAAFSCLMETNVGYLPPLLALSFEDSEDYPKSMLIPKVIDSLTLAKL